MALRLVVAGRLSTPFRQGEARQRRVEAKVDHFEATTDLPVGNKKWAVLTLKSMISKRKGTKGQPRTSKELDLSFWTFLGPSCPVWISQPGVDLPARCDSPSRV